MKGHIESTIAQRQYENIKTYYEFNNEAEKEEAIQAVIADCIKYSGIVKKEAEKLPETFTMNGIAYKKINGKWKFYDNESEKWVGDKEK